MFGLYPDVPGGALMLPGGGRRVRRGGRGWIGELGVCCNAGMQEVPFALAFTAGELSPWLSSRFDFQPYRRGAALLQNFMVQPYGGVCRRRGSRLIEVLEEAPADGIFLYPFVFSESDVLLLLFMPGKMRIYRDGLPVVKNDSAYELSVPWDNPEEIRKLRVSQVNDVLYVASGARLPYMLTRRADNDWSCQVVSLTPFPRESYHMQSAGLRVKMLPDGANVLLTLDNASPARFYSNMAYFEFILADMTVPTYVVFENESFPISARVAPDLQTSNVARGEILYTRNASSGLYCFYQCISTYLYTDYNGSANPGDYPAHFMRGVMRLRGGKVYEVCGDWELRTSGTWNAEWELWRSYDSILTAGMDATRWSWTRVASFSQGAHAERKNVVLSGSEPEPCRMVLVCLACSDLTVPPCVYMTIFGGTREYRILISQAEDGSTEAKGKLTTVYQDNHKVFYTKSWSFGAFGPRNGFPSFTALHQNRLWFGGIAALPTTLFASATDDYSNFRIGSNDSDALHLTLATSDQSRICWICPARQLLVGTSESEWTLSAADGGAVTPTNAQYVRQSSVGSENMAASCVENTVFYVQRGSRRLREVSYKLEADGFTSTDTSLLAEHLFRSGIVQFVAQRGANTHVWALMKDGGLAVMTMNMEQQVTAWQRVHMEGRRVCCLAALPSKHSNEDEIWMIVRNESSGAVSLEVLSDGNMYVDGCCELEGSSLPVCVPLHLAGLRGYVFPKGMPEAARDVEFGEDGSVSADALEPGTVYCFGSVFESRLRTMPLESEVSFDAVRQIGRVKLRLLDSAAHFSFRAVHAERWEEHDPAREQLAEPYTGAVRLSHIPSPGVGQGVELLYSGTRDFCLLSLTAEIDYHGR